MNGIRKSLMDRRSFLRKSWLLPFGMVFTKQVFPVKLKEKPERPEISINEKLTDTFYKIDEYRDGLAADFPKPFGSKQ